MSSVPLECYKAEFYHQLQVKTKMPGKGGLMEPSMELSNFPIEAAKSIFPGLTWDPHPTQLGFAVKALTSRQHVTFLTDQRIERKRKRRCRTEAAAAAAAAVLAAPAQAVTALPPD